MPDKYSENEHLTAETANAGHKQLVKYCLDTIQDIEKSEYRKNTIQEIKTSNEIYDQIEQDNDDPWEGASNCVLPLLTISCDNLEPRLASSLVGRMPFVHFEVENDQPQDAETELLQTFYNQELEDTVKIKRVAGEVVNQLVREGTVYVLPEYALEEEIKRDFMFVDDIMEQLQPQIAAIQQRAGDLAATDPAEAENIKAAAEQQIAELIPPNMGGVLLDPEQGGPLFKQTQEVVFEGGRVDIIPFNDVLIPDNVDDMEKAPVFRVVRPTYAELMRDASSKKGYIQKNIGKWLCDEQIDTDIPKEDQSATQQISNIKVDAKKKIPCYECYVRYIPKDDDQEDEKETEDFTEHRLLALIAKDSGIILRILPLIDVNFTNKHLIKRLRLFPKKGKSYGTSIYGKIKAIQEGATKTFNTAINVAEVTMIPWFLFTDATGLDKHQGGIELAAGKGIPVDSIEGLYFPRFSINPDQILKWIDLWVSFWERLISIGDLQVGRSGSKDTTATETMAVIQEGNIKHNYQSASIQDDFVEIIRTLYDMYYQHMPLDKTFLWNGQQVPVNRASMKRKYKFKLTGSTDLSNKLIERKEKETFHAFALSDPNINPLKASEELIKSYGYTDIKQWISPGIQGIVNTIMQTPGASEVVQQTLQQYIVQMQEAQKAQEE